jgi:hypothetical protein
MMAERRSPMEMGDGRGEGRLPAIARKASTGWTIDAPKKKGALSRERAFRIENEF